MAGPIDFGSPILANICTKPTSVPIIPMAGAKSPQASKIEPPAFALRIFMPASVESAPLIAAPS